MPSLIIRFKKISQFSLLLRGSVNLFLILTAACSISFTSNGFAQAIPGAGGNGGSISGNSSGSGGASSITTTVSAGGSTATRGSGGGGGGAGFNKGGNGGSGNGSTPGGAGFSLGVDARNGGTTNTAFNGGGGGGGGATKFAFSGVRSSSLTATGTNGGNGGAAAAGGSGGGGGGGGNGAIVNAGGNLTNTGIITGGNGGAGGANTISTSPSATGGNGGNGGAGVWLTDGTALINNGNINGGNGGAGGVSAGGLTYNGINGSSGPGVYVALGSTSTIVNNGTLSGGTGSYGIGNAGAISNLTNSQTGLTYTGALPTNYNIIINSPSNFGQLAVTSGTGSTTFGIYAGSILSAATYSSVLTGVSSSSIANYGAIFNTWNNFNSSYKWELVQGANATSWDLLVALAATNMSSGTVYQSSNLGATVNPVFDGGRLQVSSAGSIAPAFTITANNGTIDQNNVASNFTGNITNSGVGVNGKLTIINTGTPGSGAVTLSGINTYSGGTEVQAGANLSIASNAALGSGTLALVGSSTVPATLTTTATTTIANAITVSGDPVFNVTPTTTTTITAPIADGASAGDVVVSGGGTLALTAANTYTGNTTIDSGSTLILSGDGSIANSGTDTAIGTGVYNNGTFNIAGLSANTVSIGKNYTQSSTGTLAMSFSPMNNQKLLVAGVASLAGDLSLAGSAGTYRPGRYSLLSAGSVTGTFGSLSSNLSSYTTLGYQLAYDSANVYLVFTPNVADTQQSLVNTSQALQNTFTLQNAVLANSFSYDCTEFGANGICISAGGRNTAVSAANGLNNTSGLLIAAHRPHQNYRVGAYIDQNLSMNNAGSTVNLGNNTPLIGLFGAWNQKLDGTGMEVKAVAAYGQKNATVTRQVVGTSEAGSGSSQLNSQGAQVVAKYGFAASPEVIVSPYAGIRYTQNNMGGYTEGNSSTVTAPLTYSVLNTNATTALIGLGASYRMIPTITAFASAGVETDTNATNGTYSATGISGLTPINFNANPVKTRPTAMLGTYYDVAKNQRLGVTGIYRQEPFQAVSTTTVMATYTIGM